MQLKIFRPITRSLRSANGACVQSVLAALLFTGAPVAAVAQDVGDGCGQLTSPGRFGPFDYRADRYIPESTYRSHRALLNIVEGEHFTPEVESLRRGKTSAAPISDLAYTLHAFPNHHRALVSIARLGEREKTDKPNGSPYTVDCWFRRAIAWRSDDSIVRLIYADHLARNKQESLAEEQLKSVASTAGVNAFTHQNIGLIYFDMKNYEKALLHAHRLLELGLVRSVLIDQLKSVTKWSEPLDSTVGELPKISP